MKKLLVVTDHRFYQYGNEIYDKYVFGYEFFQDYLKVFDKVTVIARSKEIFYFPDEFVKTTGKNLEFISVGDQRGLKWFLNSGNYLKTSTIDFRNYTAVCVRIPSALSYSVFKRIKRHKLPLMFEFIGDPKAALLNQNDSIVKRKALSFIGDIMNIQMQRIVNYATCGSYVSFKHLQRKFPTKASVQTDTISSIRLENRYILERLNPISLETLKIIHVGSFVPVKNQEFLMDFLYLLLSEGFKAEITFIGDGALLPYLREKVKRLNLINEIKFEGHITGIENITSKIDEHNIFILPSFSEGMPRALIEAMARGILCFGSKRGGIKELLEEEYLFEPSDPPELLLKIKSLLKNKSAIEVTRKKNLEKARLFEKSRLSEKRQKLLKNLINNV